MSKREKLIKIVGLKSFSYLIFDAWFYIVILPCGIIIRSRIYKEDIIMTRKQERVDSAPNGNMRR